MAAFTVPCPKSYSLALVGSSAQHSNRNVGKISFPLADSSCFFRFQRKQLPALKLKAKLNEVTTEETSNSIPVDTKSSVTVSKECNGSAGKLDSRETIPDASSISALMGQVSDLVKLVDAKDIMELQLKHMDCEITIRKKEAVWQPAIAAPMAMIPTPFSHAMLPSQVSPAPNPSPLPTSAGLDPPAATATPVTGKQSSSSHLPLKCPMAGTLYRSPAPGEPPFVKVGDKVQKGQVVCIIEAMKLMNEIEADQTGTIAEILVEDGKPVSVDTPLFVIAP